MTETTLVGAINLALHRAMADDPDVVVIGEDIGLNGGVFRATEGLLDAFGAARVRDTPLAESAIGGLCVGMASQGLKPVAEIQFLGFIWPAMDHIVNHASRLRNRTRGRLSCPMVIRAPTGAGIHAPEHHSESVESMFAHVPGMRVVIPSSPQKAYGLMLAAIRDPDPVLFLEPARLYRSVRQDVKDDGEAMPLDACFTVREGTDLTLVTWGAMVMDAVAAADALAGEGVSAEIIDVATISRFDADTVLASVAKTGRCVIVHEAARTCGFGAEISARLAEEGLMSLMAPVERVTAPDVIVPLPEMEDLYIPSRKSIKEAARRAVAYQ